jgi:hypothetical protein
VLGRWRKPTASNRAGPIEEAPVTLAIFAAMLGGLVVLGAAAWFWGEDSRDPYDHGPLSPR